MEAKGPVNRSRTSEEQTRHMPNINQTLVGDSGTVRNARLGREAGADHLGMSLYELEPGQEMVFHYHLQREELVIVLAGTVALRTFDGWSELPAGEVLSFSRGPDGAHGFANRSDEPARILVISEQNAPNISVYPDANEIGIFDAPHQEERRFGARFRVDDAIAGYGGAAPALVRANNPS